MAKKKIVLKVNNNSKKSRKEILSAVAKIEGVEKLEMDGNKGILTVVGEVEPVPIFKALKKIGQTPEIMSVGPPKPHGPYCFCSTCRPNSDQQQKGWNSDQQQKGWDLPVYPCAVPCNNSYCKQCQIVYLPSSEYESGTCSIQ